MYRLIVGPILSRPEAREENVVLPTTLRYSQEKKMEKCEICGKETKRIYHIQGYTLCSKHMHQLYKHGKFLDNNPRTAKDLNEYRIEGDTAIFDLYEVKTSTKIAEFIVDLEDIEKIKYHKWRLAKSRNTHHVLTGSLARGTQRDLSWVVLGLDNRDEKNSNIVVDHKNGNGLDNRKINLRVCTQEQNVCNKAFMGNNTSGFIGISYRKDRDRYDPEIRKDSKRCHLGYTSSLEEAVYKRYYAEQLIFGEFANQQEQERKYSFTRFLPQETKEKLRKIVEQKLIDKGLWQ